MGVKQGEPLSPLLFILFINDMSEYLKDESVEVVSLEELQIFLLLFADDTVLFSYTVEGLQILLGKLSMYCEKWNVTVNVDKTVAVAFKVGNRPDNFEVYYNNESLSRTNKFTYLGVTLSANGRSAVAQFLECLTRDRRAAGSSLTGGVTALWSLSKTHLS